MEQDKFEKLNSLYKSLKRLDLDILAKFNHAEITDEDYFFYGIHKRYLTAFNEIYVDTDGFPNAAGDILEIAK